MQKSGDQIIYSATDLTRFADCQHLTWLDRLNLDQPMEKADDDDQARLIQSKGIAHELDFLAELRTKAESVIEVDPTGSLEQRALATDRALRDGVEAIYQATLLRGNLVGHADFLMRVGRADECGRFSYEVVDTKLAQTAKAKFIVQLCFYSELLGQLTGRLPSRMHVELGNGRRETFQVLDYIHYFRQLLGRFEAFVGRYPDSEPPYPEPCDFCSLCHWRERCELRRVEDDHLSGVANITKEQVKRLEAAGITSIAMLGSLPANQRVPGVADHTLDRLREQASLQIEERETGRQRAKLIRVPEGEPRGLARLPRPDPGDLFFDMEGDPMEPGGLEYLFGVYYFDEGLPSFKCFWAHDRDAERRAFIEFLDFVGARVERHPNLHIYHYANYENAALKRLMSSHGVREADVDQLLREGRLVDLFKVVKEGLRISKPSYSIKALEALYSEAREGGVTKAVDSIVVYERWRETKEPALLEAIRRYNEVDCRSTWQLRDWLLELRPTCLPWFELPGHRIAEAPKRPKSDKTVALEATLAMFHRRLLVAPENPHLQPEVAELVYYLLDFHRRADKPVWWALFERQSAEPEDLLEDPDVIGGLFDPEYVGDGERFGIYRYRYPEQDFKAREGGYGKRLDTLQDVRIHALDMDEQTIEVELGSDESGQPPPRLAISTGAPVNVDAIRAALFAFAEDLIHGAAAHKAVRHYLERRIPTIDGVTPGEPILREGKAPLAQAIWAVERLQESYLFIQGPPGTGKTYTGSHVIAALLRAGKRVAVSSNSHKAIANLLLAVEQRAKELGFAFVGMKRNSSPDQSIQSSFITNVYSDRPILQERPQLVGGTAWLLSKAPMWGQFDYLFIDEAGQVSLANVVAMGMCARNLVLLGDQMQLGQPIQGVHPGRSGESALEFLLEGEPTIAADRGIFLDTTFRMHPDICRFISEAIYNSRLRADPCTFKQSLILNEGAHPALKSTGIRYFPVEHDARSQKCPEEADVVVELVTNLLTQSYRNGQGEIRKLTLEDILIVAPYNMQVNLLRGMLPIGARVGTVDKFQGQEAQVVLVSMATSGPDYLPRFVDFLYSRNRLNVALSRARCLAILLASDRLRALACTTPRQAALVNTLCWVAEQS